MDDLNKKKPSKPGRQRAAPSNGPVATDTRAAAPGMEIGHGPDAALKPTAEGAATLANAVAAANGAAGTAPPATEIVEPPARQKNRLKPVRASFAVPKDDHATLAALKDACRAHGVPAKKNQLLRVAIGLLREVEPARLAQLVTALPPTTRKKK